MYRETNQRIFSKYAWISLFSYSFIFLPWLFFFFRLFFFLLSSSSFSYFSPVFFSVSFSVLLFRYSELFNAVCYILNNINTYHAFGILKYLWVNAATTMVCNSISVLENQTKRSEKGWHRFHLQQKNKKKKKKETEQNEYFILSSSVLFGICTVLSCSMHEKLIWPYHTQTHTYRIYIIIFC